MEGKLNPKGKQRRQLLYKKKKLLESNSATKLERTSIPRKLLESNSKHAIDIQERSIEDDDEGKIFITKKGEQDHRADLSFSSCGKEAEQNDGNLSTENEDSVIEPKEKLLKLENSSDKRIRPTTYKAYHRQIEKRRRNKINDMISEIASLVPMCQNVSHRLDKLSVLELAVQHMRMITNSSSDQEQESIYKPKILSEDEMKFLLEKASNGFLLVLSSDKAQILHVSDAVSNSTCHTPVELIGRSLLELVHAKDVAVINNMLSPYPSMPTITRVGGNTRQSDPSTCTSSLGAKRSFLFRLKTSKQLQFDQASASKSNRYRQTIPSTTMIPVKCTGFLKSWHVTSSSSSPTSSSSNIDSNVHLSTFSCFIAIAQPILNSPINNVMTSSSTMTSSTSLNTKDNFNSVSCIPQKYSSRHSADSTYLFVDDRVVPIAGYLPQDLIGSCEYKFVHKDDVQSLSDTYKQVLQSKHQERIVSDVYRFKMKHGGMLPIRTVAFSFFNPFTKKLEFVSHENFVMSSKDISEEMSSVAKHRLSMSLKNQKLALKAKVDSAIQIHDNKDTHESKNGQNDSRENGHEKDKDKSEVSKLNSSLLKPYSINVLKHNGINTDVLNEILKKHQDSDIDTDANDVTIDATMLSNVGSLADAYLKNIENNMTDMTSSLTETNDRNGRSSGYGSN